MQTEPRNPSVADVARPTPLSPTGSSSSALSDVGYSPEHPIFYDSRNNLVFRTSAFAFRCRREHLAASSVFFATLLADSSAMATQRTADGLPIIEVDDHFFLLEKWLIFCHPLIADPVVTSTLQLEGCVRSLTLLRRDLRSLGKSPAPCAAAAAPFGRLIAICDKYNSRSLLIDVLLPQARVLYKDVGAPAMLALSILHDAPKLVSRALVDFSGSFAVRRRASTRLYEYTRPVQTLASIPQHLYRRVASTDLMWELLRAQDRLCDPACPVSTWKELVEDELMVSRSGLQRMETAHSLTALSLIADAKVDEWAAQPAQGLVSGPTQQRSGLKPRRVPCHFLPPCLQVA